MKLKRILVQEKITFFILIIVCVMFLVVVLWRLPYANFRGDRISLSPLDINMWQLNFAGEPVIVDVQSNPLWLEKLEQELLINRFSLYQFLLYHKRSAQYFPYIDSYLKESGVPADFKYLAVAESGLQYDALSSAGARWIWQLMPETARQYGLRVDKYIDERLNFERSTRVAAKYLLDLKKKFGNWTLAAAGYNRGPSGLQRDIDAQPTAKNYYDLILNSETGNYVYRVVAIKYLMQNRWQLFSPETLGDIFQTPKTTLLTLQWPITDLRVYCLTNDIDYQELRELNPWILSYVLPDGPWEVKILIK